MDPFVAEIRIYPFNFAPKGWAFCDGQLLPLSQNTALFSLLGTTYGGDGKSNFALPDMQGNAPMHPGGPDRTFARSSGGFAYKAAPYNQVVPFSSNMIAPAGGDQPHNNLMPYLTLNFCIALQGVYPPRT